MSKQTDLNRVANTVRSALLKNNIVQALTALRRVPQDVALEVLAVAVDGVEPTKRGKLIEALGFSGDDDFDVFDVLGAEPSTFDSSDDSDFSFFSYAL
jgi:hypothetical protein